MTPPIAAQLQIGLAISSAATVAAVLVGWVSIVYLAMAFGVRHGELVWSGSHVGRLPAEQRWWSVFYGLALLGSALVLLDLANVVALESIPQRWNVAEGFVATCLLGGATVVALVKGSTWERMFFAPITLLGAGVAYWLAFAS